MSQPPVASPVPPVSALHTTAVPGPRLGNSYGAQPSMLPSSYSSSPATTLSTGPISHTAAATTGYSQPVTAPPPVSARSDPSYDYTPPIKQELSYDHSSGIDPDRHMSSTSLPESSRVLDQKPPPHLAAGNPSRGELPGLNR